VEQSWSAIESHVANVHRYALVLSANRPDAEDLAQECLVRALARRGRELENPQAYLFTILRNVRIDQAAKRRRHAGNISLDEAMPELARQATQSQGLVQRDLLRILRRLPRAHWQVVQLVCIEELTYQEAALFLGLPIGTIMSRLARARARLRGFLD
jgi:RNA polymerase sigma-70 factor (ECF subfamily)